jgi:thiamine-monophosphate kinase
MVERVRDISEFELIGRLRDALPESVRWSSEVRLGIGDDAALWDAPPTQGVLVTTDSLIDTVHFRTDWTTWRDLGWKALAVNISDIAAMGGNPKLATVSLALTGNELVTDLVKLYRGMGAIARKEGMVIAGGDIVRAPHDFGIHVTVLGNTHRNGLLTRNHARPGDLIAVTGTLGAAAAGLALLQLRETDPRRTATTAPILIEAHTRPRPRVQAGRLALEHGATAAMDLSDGLFGDLPKILTASGVRAEIDLAAIPVAASIRALFPDQWLDLATRGGEDYELLLTVPPERFDTLQIALAGINQTLTAIGEIIAPQDRSAQLVARDLNGALHRVEPGAFDHFRKPSS